jgi:hypothetical protein
VEEGFAVANLSSSTCVGSNDSFSFSKQMSQVEKRDSANFSGPFDGVPIKLDCQGLPLVPQPSRFTDDPLVSFYEPCIPPRLNH